jgi:2-polyprenyl-3-methyl-5-hydroxy-6-metoxy-1,4-benzoquinol methylase
MTIDNNALCEYLLKRKLLDMKNAYKDRDFGNYSKIYEKNRRTQNVFDYFKSCAKSFDNSRKINVLDLGCGDGCLSFYMYFENRGKNVFFQGVDMSETGIELANKFKEYMHIEDSQMAFSLGDIEKLGLKENSFDLIICCEVIEHLHDPAGFLRSTAKFLKPGGTFLITTPNAGHPLVKMSNILKGLAGKKPSCGEEKPEYWVDPGHISVMNLKQLKDCAKRAGLKVEKIKRGSLLFGGEKYNKYTILVALYIIIDTLLNYLPFSKTLTEDFTMIMKKP